MPEFNDPSVPPFPKTNAEQPAQRRPKFRSACDACGSAKVRCDKSKPKCVRCMTRGIPCNYSISRRSGKSKKHTTREAFTPVYVAAGSPTQNAAHQKMPKHHPLPITQTEPVEEEHSPSSVSNLGPEISSSAIPECTSDDFGMRFPANLDRRRNRCFMHIPDIQGFSHEDCWLDYMAHDRSLQHRNENSTQIQWSSNTRTMDISKTAAPATVIDSLNSSSYEGGLSPTLEDRSEAQRGNHDPLQYCSFDEALNMVTQEAFPYSQSIPQDLTTPVPFLTTSAPHAVSNPVWDYWCRHYRLDSTL